MDLPRNRIQKMLYDHSIDADETVNLAPLYRYASTVDDLSQKLKTFKNPLSNIVYYEKI